MAYTENDVISDVISDDTIDFDDIDTGTIVIP